MELAGPRAAGQRVLAAGPAWLALCCCLLELRSSEQFSSPAIPDVGASVPPPRLHLRFTLNLTWFGACFPIVTAMWVLLAAVGSRSTLHLAILLFPLKHTVCLKGKVVTLLVGYSSGVLS